MLLYTLSYCLLYSKYTLLSLTGHGTIFVHSMYYSGMAWKSGILLPKLFWPTVIKNGSSDQEKTFWDH